MKSILWLIFFSLAFSLCTGCSKNPDTSEPLSQPPSHGTSFLLQYDPAEVQADTNALANLKEAITKRLSKLGISMYWQPTNNAVRIWTPMTQQEQIAIVQDVLTHRGMLEFRLVNEDSDDLIQKGLSAPGYELMKQTNIVAGTSITNSMGLIKWTNFVAGSQTITSYLVEEKPELTGSHLQKSWVRKDAIGRPEIEFELNQEGAKMFEKLTANNIGKQLAIVLDGRISSAPKIMSPISGGSGIITGNFTSTEANELADVLDCPLPFPVKVKVEKTY